MPHCKYCQGTAWEYCLVVTSTLDNFRGVNKGMHTLHKFQLLGKIRCAKFWNCDE